ncbi:hypothetical protein OVS_02140 [Mycoplasma ovis str. Michigan]|uniref:Uncharacterized protein n=1 Tax=Mycoplasma ovis str. Michigan TaxID=1415773 RepID=A0ABM5P1H4_9MOLU|nr:hypothetical protein OVS_02140 [Mycoplasma ovis str. Michigan]
MESWDFKFFESNSSFKTSEEKLNLSKVPPPVNELTEKLEKF